MVTSALARFLILLSSFFLSTTAASAATITIGASDTGWYDEFGEHNPANQNYNTGWSTNAEFRNFFVFDLSGLPAEAVLSATLRAFNPEFGNPDVTYDDGFDSPTANEAYRLVSVATDPSTLTAGGSGLTGTYDDLAVGDEYATYLAGDADNGTIVEIPLNSLAIAAIDSATGLFALGGHLATLAKNIDVEEHFFGHTSINGGHVVELVITTVPEPGTGLLTALGLGGLALRRRRSRRSLRVSTASLTAIATLGALLLASLASAEIQVLSNRADMISDGNALIEVLLPDGTDPTGVVMDLDGSDVTAQFAMRPNARYMGVLEGLSLGDNVLTATLPSGGGSSSITISNHPIEGPVFSGPHLEPWRCTLAGASLPDCNAPPTISYHYQSNTQPGTFQNYDPQNPAGNVRQITTDDGNTVDYIVRRETGSINRGAYAYSVIYDPTQPFEPWDQQPGWNRKLFYPFGASCGVSYNQGNAPGVLDDQALSQGFAVATSVLNTLGHHCDTVKSAETVMMIKERIVEDLGEIRYTFGEGLSGGSIGQNQVANAYPGLLQGLIPGLTYPDVWTTAMDVADCVLLRDYFQGPGFGTFPDPLDQLAVEGHGTLGVCQAWIALFGPLLYPDNGCGAAPAPDYDKDSQFDGCRSQVNSLQVNVWGRRPQDNFAKRAYTNDGTQYGLVALLDGTITAEQFVHLNETIGGADIDGEPTPQRTTADYGTSHIAYSAARVDDARALAEVAIIDLPSPENVEIHTPYHAFSIEERLKKAHGLPPLNTGGMNHAIWRGGTIDNPGAPAFDTMDAWLTAVEADASGDTLAEKIVNNRPLVADPANGVFVAKDSCFNTPGVQTVYENDDGTEDPLLRTACDANWPFYGSPRLAAGSPLEKDVIQCTLKPVDFNDYLPATFDGAQQARLLAAYPNGVCDYGVPGRGQQPSQTWITYEGGPGGVPLGPPPGADPPFTLPEPSAWPSLLMGALVLGALRGRRRD